MMQDSSARLDHAVQIRLSGDLRRQLVEVAAKDDRPLARVVREALRSYLEARTL